jgi:hypothetical protein
VYLKYVRIFQNVMEKSFINWRVLPLVKINTRISDTPCIFFIFVYFLFLFIFLTFVYLLFLYNFYFYIFDFFVYLSFLHIFLIFNLKAFIFITLSKYEVNNFVYLDATYNKQHFPERCYDDLFM